MRVSYDLDYVFCQKSKSKTTQVEPLKCVSSVGKLATDYDALTSRKKNRCYECDMLGYVLFFFAGSEIFLKKFSESPNEVAHLQKKIFQFPEKIFVISREVFDQTTQQVTTAADYSELGFLLIAVGLITIIIPITVVRLIQRSPLRSTD